MQRHPPKPTPHHTSSATVYDLSRFLKPPPAYTHDTRSRPPPPSRQIAQPQSLKHPSLTTNNANASAPTTSVLSLLPYVTNRGHLSEADITNIAEVAGSLRELVSLAIWGEVDSMGRDKLEESMGEVAQGVREFWGAEWVVD
jgi:hypothetical protein